MPPRGPATPIRLSSSYFFAQSQSLRWAIAGTWVALAQAVKTDHVLARFTPTHTDRAESVGGDLRSPGQDLHSDRAGAAFFGWSEAPMIAGIVVVSLSR